MKDIIDLLNMGEYYGGNEYIEIAKGKYELTLKPSGLIAKIRRKYYKYITKWQLKNK